MKFIILHGLRWEKTQHTYHSYTTLPGDSAPLGVINTAATRGGNENHSREGGLPVRKDTSPLKINPRKKIRRRKPSGSIPSPPHGEPRY